MKCVRFGPWATVALLVTIGPFEGALLAGSPLLPRGISDREKEAADAVLERYLRNKEGASRAGEGGESAVAFEIEAALPKLKKQGILRGLKLITGAGRVAFAQLHFVGDDLIRTAVISRFLTLETKGQIDSQDAAIASRNYRFYYRRISSYNGRTAFVFRMEPRSRHVGLFKGELWIDSETARPLREWGELVKSPSALLSHIYVVRDYDADGPDPHLRRIVLRLKAVFAGTAELTMWLDEPQGTS